jgi:hypothetical protein
MYGSSFKTTKWFNYEILIFKIDIECGINNFSHSSLGKKISCFGFDKKLFLEVF